jgi:predicted Zn finger-like uncharacterized protein
MYSQCPSCRTIYYISVAQLRAGRGEVLCQSCDHVFSALSTLADNVKDAIPDEVTPVNPPVLGLSNAVRSSQVDQEVLAEPTSDELPRQPAISAESVSRYDTWNEELEARPSSRASRMAWGVGTLLLLALLIGQIGVFEGRRLAQNEHLRPWLEIVCESLRCSLPAFKDIHQIRIIDRALQPAPEDIDGLEFSLVLANEARFPQAFPVIKLVLTEVNGKPIGARVFQPEEYLDANQAVLMPVGKPFEIHLLLAKPSREVGGFAFELI